MAFNHSVSRGDHILIKTSKIAQNSGYKEVEVLEVYHSRKSDTTLVVRTRRGNTLRIVNAAQKIIKRIYPSFGQLPEPLHHFILPPLIPDDRLKIQLRRLLVLWGFRDLKESKLAG